MDVQRKTSATTEQTYTQKKAPASKDVLQTVSTKVAGIFPQGNKLSPVSDRTTSDAVLSKLSTGVEKTFTAIKQWAQNTVGAIKFQRNKPRHQIHKHLKEGISTQEQPPQKTTVTIGSLSSSTDTAEQPIQRTKKFEMIIKYGGEASKDGNDAARATGFFELVERFANKETPTLNEAATIKARLDEFLETPLYKATMSNPDVAAKCATARSSLENALQKLSQAQPKATTSTPEPIQPKATDTKGAQVAPASVRTPEREKQLKGILEMIESYSGKYHGDGYDLGRASSFFTLVTSFAKASPTQQEAETIKKHLDRFSQSALYDTTKWNLDISGLFDKAKNAIKPFLPPEQENKAS